jgi:hypothetical protein
MVFVKDSLLFEFGNDLGNEFSELPEQRIFVSNYLSYV